MAPPTALVVSLALAIGLAGLPAQAETMLIRETAPSGPGSLQAALDIAANSPSHSVIIMAQTGSVISLTEGLRYEGASGLTIIGNDLTLASEANITLLSILGAVSVRLSGITFTGPGGWSVENRGDTDGPAGSGLFVGVAETAEGIIDIMLEQLSVRGVAGHGVHIADCAPVEDCAEGSDAGIALSLRDVEISNVGLGRFDSDGLRVDERGPGGITLHGMFVMVSGVGADGIELDEGQDGDVDVRIVDARFTENGGYCDPDLLAAFLPDTPEGEFGEGSTMAADIPGPVAESPDDACFERDVDYHGDGSIEEYEFSIDVDDGFDIDEAGPGGIHAIFADAVVSGNLDQGFDFDEDGPGAIETSFINVFAEGNSDDAFKLSEAGGGDVIVSMALVQAIGNGGVGIVAEEEDDGDLSMVLNYISTVGNDGGELGIEAVQEDAGEGIIHIIDSEIADGIETEGAAIDPD